MHMTVFGQWMMHMLVFGQWMTHMPFFGQWMTHMSVFGQWMPFRLFVEWKNAPFFQKKFSRRLMIVCHHAQQKEASVNYSYLLRSQFYLSTTCCLHYPCHSFQCRLNSLLTFAILSHYPWSKIVHFSYELCFTLHSFQLEALYSDPPMV